VVAVQKGQVEILRPGPVTLEDLRGNAFHSLIHRQDADATHRGMGFQPMDPREGFELRYGSNLTHWTQIGAAYAVTFRLADSLPADVVDDWERERRDIIHEAKVRRGSLTDFHRERLSKLFSEKVERFLDRGVGNCWLRDERIATVVRDALLFFEGDRYILYAWCIMPNHVHVVLQPKAGFELPDILHSWKSFTALKANRILNAGQQFWQPESYDHLIRDEQDLINQIRYVEQNPAEAGLTNWRWVSRGMGFQPMIHRQDADATKPPRSPGQLPSHYAPKTTLRLVDSGTAVSAPLSSMGFQPMIHRQDADATTTATRLSEQRVGLLAWNQIQTPNDFAEVRLLSANKDLREAAANLFRYLRELDSAGVDVILAELVPEEGLGVAINDRLRRAAQK
jgi:REP element-mobilizing transposase RayT